MHGRIFIDWYACCSLMITAPAGGQVLHQFQFLELDSKRSCSAAHMAAPRTTTLNAMGDDVLGVIFMLLPPMDRCSCHALVTMLQEDHQQHLPRICL